MKLCDRPPTWRQALQFFLGEYLPRHRGVSPHTLQSYATALRLLTAKIATDGSSPHQLQTHQVLQFLEGLERTRGNSAHTRNLRLAALRSFWKALQLWDPEHEKEYERLLRVPFKRCQVRSPDYLELHELKQLFQTMDTSTHQGFRDLTLLRYLYNTGSRVSEVSEARTCWLSLGDPPETTIRGKGGRSRVCPLWHTTAEMLRLYLRQERAQPRKGYEDFLFITRRGTAFRRQALWKLIHGYLEQAARTTETLRKKHITPHSLRHSTAVHLLRAGVEINVIKAWLGHADVSTTSRYLDLDLDKKRKALELFLALDVERLTGGAHYLTPLPANILAWLERL